ncbi:MAG: hypothetical protein ACYDAM_09130 [Leptospirales bacterium]
MAKAILNVAATCDMIARVEADINLRRILGWELGKRLPDESAFSRVNATLSSLNIPLRAQEALANAQGEGSGNLSHGPRLFGHQGARKGPEHQEERSRQVEETGSPRKRRIRCPEGPLRGGAVPSHDAGRDGTGDFQSVQLGREDKQPGIIRVLEGV